MPSAKKALASPKKKLRPETIAFFRRLRHPEDKERNAREILAQSLAGPRRPGKPRNPRIQALMDREGITRQAAWYRIHRATGRPAGRPRKSAAR
jgi:hypothetical protein